MKTAGLVFMMIGYAALLYGAAHAAPSGTASQQGSSASAADTASDRPRAAHAPPADGGNHQAGEKPSGEQPSNRRGPDNNHTPSHASQAKVNRPNQTPNRKEHSASGNAMNLHEPGADKSAAAAKGGLVQNETVNSALRVRLPSAVRPTPPSLDNVRHRSPNSAVVGGSANATTRNTGAINGTHMSRKP